MRKVVQIVGGALLALGLTACPDSDEDKDKDTTSTGNTISGTVKAPAGGSIISTELVACFVVDGQCDVESSKTRLQVLQGMGTSASYKFDNLSAGQYLLIALKDTNKNNEFDPGDYVGVYGNSLGAVAVKPPAQNINITMTVNTETANTGISGTVTAPAGGSISGTQVVACFVSGGACVPDHSNTRQVTLSGTGSSGTYSFSSLAAGQYTLVAYKDINVNSQVDDGDYEGFYTTTGTSASPVTSPAQGVNIFLRVRGGGTTTPPPGVTFLRPSDFSGGSATVTLQGLSPTERVAVIPVHASQSSTVDGLRYTLNTTGVLAQTLTDSGVAALPRSDLEPAVPDTGDEKAAHQEAHLTRLSKGLRDVETLRRGGARTLGARGTVRAQALDNCAAPYTVGSKACSFWISNGSSQTRITATLRHSSPNAYWFVQNEDTSEFSSSELQSLANDFETRVIPSDNRYFGDFADVDNNQKILIVFSRLLGPQGLLGYVLPLDLYDDANAYPATGTHSNEGDIFYAATPGTLGSVYSRSSYFSTVMPATMVHELKHLIATGRRHTADNLPEELWIEEGSAMAAQQLAGLGTQVGEMQPYARYALAAPQNYRVVHASRPSSHDEGLGIYGYNFLFVWRAAQAVGHDTFWRNWTAGPGRGISNLEVHTGKPFSELMLDWAAALALDHAHLIDGYDYDTFNLRDGSWTSLGYGTLQSGVSGTTRSMAYHVGRGTGANASITLQVSNGANPHAVVLRLPGALPSSSAPAAMSVPLTQVLPPELLKPARLDARALLPQLLTGKP
ncbi:carboxypeptidase regulatory-like domain-containing protein [Archangium violaceum]|uniref:carboxypeptidase-like regulatory domain-containing protein n=1 Tax=Archangium violaceum TaxID=83451 RepID=UPI00193B248A|nr:carboxypeptidase-like regulatory domain-containing protein [Archangium violaceum]QRK12031.1 carboxypeptidase regulatory-like domain-containing protein [Archangium violaceum]